MNLKETSKVTLKTSLRKKKINTILGKILMEKLKTVNYPTNLIWIKKLITQNKEPHQEIKSDQERDFIAPRVLK